MNYDYSTNGDYSVDKTFVLDNVGVYFFEVIISAVSRFSLSKT